MARRQIILVSQCRAVDLRIGDVIREDKGWCIVQGLWRGDQVSDPDVVVTGLLENLDARYVLLRISRDEPALRALHQSDKSESMVWQGRWRKPQPPLYDWIIVLAHDLVDLQVTQAVYSNAPHQVDVALPEVEPSEGFETYEPGKGHTMRVPIDDEGEEVAVTVHRSALDNAVVVDVDITFDAADDIEDLRIMLNDSPVWKNGAVVSN